MRISKRFDIVTLFVVYNIYAHYSNSRANGKCQTPAVIVQQYIFSIARILRFNVDKELACEILCKRPTTSRNNRHEQCSLENSTMLVNNTQQGTSFLLRTSIQNQCNCTINFEEMDVLYFYNDVTSPLICSMVEVLPTNFLEMAHVKNKDSTVLDFSANALLIYIIGAIIASIGVVGNAIAICVIMCRKSLQTPTYRMLVHLAVGDVFSIMIVFVCFFTSLTYAITFCDIEKYFLPILFLCAYLCMHNSSIQIVLLSVLRYFLIVHPLKCRKYLTCKRVSYASFIGSLISVVMAGAVLLPLGREYIFGGYLSMYTNMISSSSDIMFTFMFFTIYMTVVPTALLLTFHLLKIKQVSRSKSSSKSTNDMFIVVTMIIIIYIIPAATDLAFTATSLSIGIEWYQSNTLLFYCVNLLWLIRYGSNPFIYFFLSPPGKKFCSGLANVGTCFRRKHKIRFKTSGDS